MNTRPAPEFSWLSAILAGFLPLMAGIARADWIDGQDADLVLGQPNFDTGNPGTSVATLKEPFDVAVDPTTGNVFVSDSGNHRVLRYPSLETLSDGEAAVGVLGQADLNSGGAVATPTAGSMFFPRGIAIDGNGTLWVVDEFNHRVLRFDNASAKADGDGADADGVLGQGMFDTKVSGTTQSTMNQPNDVAVDANGTLWVADTINNRVLRFANAANKANGSLAEGVLGQSTFLTSASAPITATSMFNPGGVAVDGAGRLWVADYANNRVLRFDDASNKSNGAAAENVFGQSLFTTAGFFPTEKESSFSHPADVAVTPNGDLWVTDFGHHRAVRFASAAASGIRPAGSNVLGQPDLATSAAGQSVNRINTPNGVTAVGNTLILVVDQSNHRVLRFRRPPDPPQASAPSGSSALKAALQVKIKRLKKAIKRAKKKRQTPKIKRLKRKLKRFKKRVRAL